MDHVTLSTVEGGAGGVLNPQAPNAGRVGGPGAAPGESDGLLWTVTTQRVLSLLGRKWVVAIVRTLHDEAKRPGQLRREIRGIQPKVLRETLRALEAEGLVEQVLVRDSYDDRYICWSLTVHGRTLGIPLAALYQWGRQHLAVDMIDLTEHESPPVG